MIEQFREAIISAGLEPPAHIEPGKFIRFPGARKNGSNRAGWCQLFADGHGGIFGDWATGLNQTWQAEHDRPQTPQERAEFKRKVDEARRQAEEQRREEQSAAAAKAADFLKSTSEANPDHPYLQRKTIGTHGARQKDKQLIIPMADAAGELLAVQAIDPAGGKMFWPSGCTTKGAVFKIGSDPVPGEPILIAEGFATGAAIHEATGHQVIVAFNAGNLERVARAVRDQHHDHPVILCADDDAETEGNPGITKATAAAQAIGGKLAVPGMAKKADFWDLRAEQGEEAVQAAVAAAVEIATGTDHQDGEVRQPAPLPDLPSVAPFDYDLLPESFKPWVRDIAERLQCPPDFVAVAAMVALAVVVGRKVVIRPKQHDSWAVVANLWALIVGRPGIMKTPGTEATFGPMNMLIARALDEYDEAMQRFEADKMAGKLRGEVREKEARKRLSENPDADLGDLLFPSTMEAPTLRRYRTNDTSPASLGELLRLNPNGLLVYRDELVSLLKGLDKEDQAEGRGFYLTGWNGDSPYTIDRIGRGLHLHIPAVCISLLGGTQPGRLAEYTRQAVRGGAADDGLMQRFGLLVWPDPVTTWKNIDRPPDYDAERTAYAVFDRLDRLDLLAIDAELEHTPDGDPTGLPFLRFSAEALPHFQEWHEALEVRLRSGELHPALESHFSKYRKLVPALALLIHLADDGRGPVSEVATLKALAWTEYLETHAHRVYGAVTQAEVAAAKAILRRIKRGDLKPPFASHDVWRPGWTGLSDRELVGRALEMLTDYGHLVVEVDRGTGGRPATRYRPDQVEVQP